MNNDDVKTHLLIYFMDLLFCVKFDGISKTYSTTHSTEIFNE